MGGRYRAPDRRMDCSPADGGIRLGPSPAVPYPRSRPRLWRGGHPAPPGPGDQRSTDIAAITLAECLCGTADRLGPPRVRRPCCRVRRTAPSPPVARVLEQGRTVTACRPGDRPHYQPSDLGRAPSPILPDMICGRDTMIETRITKVVMVASLALFALLVTFDNLTDYDTNYAFV